MVQISGKTRGNVRAPKSADREALQALALASPQIQKYVAGQPVRKVVVVPGRLINLVV